MSLYYRDNGAVEERTYDREEDKRTKQAFMAETDINRLLARAQKDGSLSHLEAHGAEYGEYSTFDFHESMNRLARGNEIFGRLPSELRNEFNNDPGAFFAFVNDEANKDKLPDLFPALARPGRYNLDVRPTSPPGATTEPAPVDPPSAPAAETESPAEGE